MHARQNAFNRNYSIGEVLIKKGEDKENRRGPFLLTLLMSLDIILLLSTQLVA